jgi:hypothetical protein
MTWHGMKNGMTCHETWHGMKNGMTWIAGDYDLMSQL